MVPTLFTAAEGFDRAAIVALDTRTDAERIADTARLAAQINALGCGSFRRAA